MTLGLQAVYTMLIGGCIYTVLLIILAIIEANDTHPQPQRCEYYEAIQALDKAGKLAGKTSCSMQDACRAFANDNQNHTLAALRKGVQKYGVPKEIYVDNGKEFITADCYRKENH